MSSEKRSLKFLRKEFQAFRVAPEVTSGLIEEFLQSLDCARSLTVYMLFKYQEHGQLAALECDPLAYSNAGEFRDAYAATSFLSKFKDLNLGYDLEEKALEKFGRFELLCERTNNRFKDLACDTLFTGATVQLHNAVVRKIARILGDFSAEEVFSEANWGPGASTSIKRQDASSAKKFQCETGITRDLFALLPEELWREAYPPWASHLFSSGEYPRFEVGNKVITVPKDAKAHRVIAVEPGLNLWFQLAVGSMISKRLRRFGIDLRLQSVNQEFARVGSIDLNLATVDLSSASDSISRGVVEALLPPRWHLLLDSLRSRFGTQGKTLIEWKKFSSMGNGFTFPLESLIFYATAVACIEYVDGSDRNARSSVSVYGDDVIIPVRCLAYFSRMCEFYGFVLNMKKTHSSSLFRESCGAHYYRGVDVKPIYLKGNLSDIPSVFRFANSIRRFAHRIGCFQFCDVRFRSLFGHTMISVPKPFRLRIDNLLGDGGFVGNFDESAPRRARHGIEGYHVFHVVAFPKKRYSDGVGVLLSRLWGPPAQVEEYTLRLSSHTRKRVSDLIVENDIAERGNAIPLSGRVVYKVSRALVRRWYDFGPWL